MKKPIAYLFLNGDLNGNLNFYKDFIKNLPGDIFCADGGFNHCYALGLVPLEIWGDFDSIDSSLLSSTRDKNIKTVLFNKEKDFTDGELLLDYIGQKGYSKVFIIGGLGGRLSHTLTNLSLVTKYKNIIFLSEKETIFLINKTHNFSNLIETTISFVAFSSTVENLTLRGFKYPLNNFKLTLGTSICMSNIILEKEASVSYSSGYLICIIENCIDTSQFLR